MQPRIENIAEKKLVGKRMTMTLADNRTFALWRSFMPERQKIRNNLNAELISLQVYPPSFDFGFTDPTTEFEKWAAVEVSDFDSVPAGMEPFVLAGGLYAIFHYRGLSSDPKIFQYIFGTWLSNSNYALDHRPHFEVLGEKYKNNDPASEEEIWIPIKVNS
jgi:AraC family transcriptional regulator